MSKKFKIKVTTIHVFDQESLDLFVKGCCKTYSPRVASDLLRHNLAKYSETDSENMTTITLDEMR